MERLGKTKECEVKMREETSLNGESKKATRSWYPFGDFAKQVLKQTPKAYTLCTPMEMSWSLKHSVDVCAVIDHSKFWKMFPQCV